MTSLMNKMASSEVKVLLPSNIRKESIKGLRTIGIVSGYEDVICLTDLISKYLYSLVLLDTEFFSSIRRAFLISFSKNVVTSLIFLGETRSVINSNTFLLISRLDTI